MASYDDEHHGLMKYSLMCFELAHYCCQANERDLEDRHFPGRYSCWLQGYR